MLGRKPAVSAMTALLLAGLIGATSGQFSDRPTRDETPIADGPGPVPYVSPLPPNPLAPALVYAQPDYSLKVYIGHSLPEDQAEVLRPIRDQLNNAKIGIPDDRIAYFQSVISPEAIPVGGWSGLIHSFKQVKGGVIVQLRVFAIQSGMHDTANIMERYSLINGTVEYLGSYVPNDIPRVQIGF